MFTRILVPLDKSSLAECVLPHAVALSRRLGGRLTLLHVLEPPSNRGASRFVDALGWEIVRAEAQSYLAEQAERLGAAGVAADTAIVEGRPAAAIIDYGLKEQVTLLILSSHGGSGLTGWNVSSTVQKILTACTISTLIVRAYRPAGEEGKELEAVYRRLLVPLDGSRRADHALAAATTLARAYQAEVLLTHVVRRPELVQRLPPTPDDLDLVERLVERNEAEAAKYLEQMRARLAEEGVASRVRLLVSENSTAALHELVVAEEVDLVVLCAHGHSGSVPWPLGSSVLNMVMYGSTPLLIVQDLAPGKLQTRPDDSLGESPRRLSQAQNAA